MSKIIFAVFLFTFVVPAFAENSSIESNNHLIIKTFAMLLLVVSLIFFLAWIVKKTPMLKQGEGSMKVVSSLSLGAKERLLMVRINGKDILIGVTQHNISLLNTECSTDSEVFENSTFSKKMIDMLKQG